MFSSLADFFGDNIWAILLSALISYLLGSINSAIIVGYCLTGKDIRTMGSGNGGMTNAFRCLGKLGGFLTLAGDILKGVLSIIISKQIFIHMGGEQMSADLGFGTPIVFASYLAGFFCTLGHVFPLYFKFKGGKGILTTAAIFLMIDWRVCAGLVIVFGISFIISRYVSLSSIIAAISFPFLTFAVNKFPIIYDAVMADEYIAIIVIFSALISILVIYMHRTNISRLIKGTESRVSFKKK